MLKKNILAMLVIAALLCTMMAFSVPAEAADGNVAKIGETEYATLAEAVTAAAEGDTIVLLKAVVVGNGETLTIDKKVTITTTVTDAFTVNAGGTLNLKQVTINSTSSILWANGGIINIDGAVLTQTGSTYCAAFAENNGQINLKSGTIEAKDSTSTAVSVKGATLTVEGGKILHNTNSAISARNNAVVNIKGGEIKTTAEEAYCATFAGSGAQLNITGGEISAANGYGVVAIADGKVTISGGTVKGVRAHENANASVTISGGTINGKVTVANDATVTVTGGSFEQDVTEFCAAAARIGNTYFKTLAEAIAAVGAGDVVIELLADATMDYNAREAFGTAETTSLTINGNGHTMTLNQKNSDWSSFGLANANAKLVLNKMTIEKTGYGDTSGAWNTHAIIFTSNVEMNDVTVNNSVAVRNGATLNNVTINEANGYYGLWIEGNGQTVNVTGGAINATNGGRGIKIADQYVGTPASVTLNVTGTDFNTAKKAAVLVSSTAGAKITASNVDIKDVAADSVNFVWVDEDWAADYAKVEVTGATVVQEAAEVFAAEVKRSGKTVGYFKTLAEAIAAAAEGDTIVLFKAVVVGNGETLTIDKNVTITTSVTDAFTVNAGGTLNLGKVTINSTSSILWANGGIINIDGAVLTATGSSYVIAFAEKEGQINLKSGTIESKNSKAVTIDATGENTTVTISGGKVLHNSSSAIAARNNAVVKINGGEVKTTAETSFCAAFATNGAEIIVSGGEISAANDYGVIAAADGKVAVSGGTVKGVRAHENANAIVTISGGTINGKVTVANDATVTVTGGSFEQDVTEFCAAEHHVIKGEDGRYVCGPHAFSTKWTTDEENHWHECDCGAIADQAEHTYENGICTGCEKKDSIDETGDTVLVSAAVIMMLSAAAVVLLSKKRLMA